MATHSPTPSKHRRSHIPNHELANELHAVLQSIGDGIIVINTDREVVLCNPVAEEMLGVPAQKMKGALLENVVHVQTDTGQPTAFAVDEVFATAQPHSVCQQIFLVRRGKNTLPVTYCASPIHGQNNEARGVVLTLRDAQGEYAMHRMQTEFVSVVSHQLRTPLASVKWFLETLLENRGHEPLSNDQRDYLQQAFQSNERMIALVNDLLNMSQLERGSVATHVTPVSIGEVCQDVVADTELFAHANNVTIITQFPYANMPQVLCDGMILRQVLQNVLSNAVKYTHNHSTVSLNMEQNGTVAVLSVTDQGIGIPTIDQHRVFEPFFRAANAVATRAEGSGLGLYTSKMLIERCNGRIWLRSEEGKGTTVCIALPIAE